MRPRVGVTLSDRGSLPSWWFIVLAVWLVGGKPIRLTPKRWLGQGRAARILEGLDAFILSGGADVDPSLYAGKLVHGRHRDVKSETPLALPVGKKRRSWGWHHPLLWMEGVVVYLLRLFSSTSRVGTDAERDALEFRCLEESCLHQLPVLGICRGAQILNVFYRGTLHQNLYGFYLEQARLRTVLPLKQVEIVPGSKLAAVLGSLFCRVNSLHNQAVHQLGAGLRVAATDASGVVQAVEQWGAVFRIGVQWHPEYLLLQKEQFRLFQCLVGAARRKTAVRPSVPNMKTAGSR